MVSGQRALLPSTPSIALIEITFRNIRADGDIGYYLIQLTLLKYERMGALKSTISITARARSSEVTIRVLSIILESPPLIPH